MDVSNTMIYNDDLIKFLTYKTYDFGEVSLPTSKSFYNNYDYKYLKIEINPYTKSYMTIFGNNVLYNGDCMEKAISWYNTIYSKYKLLQDEIEKSCW